VYGEGFSTTVLPVYSAETRGFVVDEHLGRDLDAGQAVRLRGAAVDLGGGLRQRLALFARQQLGELSLVRAQHFGALLHEHGTLGERLAAPCAECRARGFHGPVEMRTVRRGAAREDFAECRIDDVELELTLFELAADQQRKIRP
jgi:hypothetical protein